MSCDARINPYKPIGAICYVCSKPVDVKEPIKGHEGCLDEWNNKPVLRIDWENKED